MTLSMDMVINLVGFLTIEASGYLLVFLLDMALGSLSMVFAMIFQGYALHCSITRWKNLTDDSTERTFSEKCRRLPKQTCIFYIGTP